MRIHCLVVLIRWSHSHIWSVLTKPWPPWWDFLLVWAVCSGGSHKITPFQLSVPHYVVLWKCCSSTCRHVLDFDRMCLFKCVCVSVYNCVCACVCVREWEKYREGDSYLQMREREAKWCNGLFYLEVLLFQKEWTDFVLYPFFISTPVFCFHVFSCSCWLSSLNEALCSSAGYRL